LLIQDIQDWEEFPLRDHIQNGADLIRFPSLRFASLWPFDSWNGPRDKVAYDREAPNLFFPYLDGLLAKMRVEIADKQQRFLAYRSLQSSGVINYKRLHELESRRLVAMDKKFGIHIGEFILENFQTKRIFHTTVRPDLQVFNLLLQYVLKSLGMKEGSHQLPESLDGLLKNPQIPVHPQVGLDLGVRWITEKTQYIYRGAEITWEAYIRSYINHYG